MKRSLLYVTIFTLALAGPLQAQTLSPDFSEILEEQGFVVLTKRYTWLGRIVITVSNGLYEREILLTRGSNQILQDTWTQIETAPADDGAIPSTAGGGAPRGGEPTPGGPGGRGEPGGAGGPEGPDGRP